MNNEKQIDGILGRNGILAGSISGYEHREQQIFMANKSLETLLGQGKLIIEAPTGTGKTLAYLTAAALSRKRVVISTGTKNLQEQIFFKDVPFLKKKVFHGLKVALLKGRGNFVCHNRFRRFMRQPYLLPVNDSVDLKDISEWYMETCSKGEGDRAELKNLSDDNPLWLEICSTSDTCLGRKCPDRDECFVFKMRAKAVDADLMIVNHHLLASDLVVRDSGFGEVIPRYEALILDEAHGFEEAVTQHFGFYVSQFKVTRLCRDIRSGLSDAGISDEKVINALQHTEDAGRRLFGHFVNAPMQRSKLEPVTPAIAETRDYFCGNLELTAALLNNVPKVTEELRAMAARAMEMSAETGTILAAEPDGEFALWTERRDRFTVLHASPIEVGGLLEKYLYKKIDTIVFTSATLSSAGNFNYFKSRMGLDKSGSVGEFILDSPFDYGRQTMLFVPDSLPDPNHGDFVPALGPVIRDVLTHSRGRAFVLFTSYRNMEAVHSQLIGKVPFPLLVQGSKPKSRLLEEFREKIGTVLFATASFWEGVDVQGEALSCVIVDKLPFAPPNDPVMSARMDKIRAQGGEPFSSFQVPMAVLALKQGFGRLIRTRTDRGVLCILDKRIVTKSYGKTFLKSLYKMPVCKDIRKIQAFFETC